MGSFKNTITPIIIFLLFLQSCAISKDCSELDEESVFTSIIQEDLDYKNNSLILITGQLFADFEPIPFCTVRLGDTICQTDPNGNFETSLLEGNHNIAIHYPGAPSISKNIDFKESTNLNIYLDYAYHVDSDIVILDQSYTGTCLQGDSVR